MKTRILLATAIAIVFMAGSASAVVCYLDEVQADQSQYQGFLNVSMDINNITMPYTIVLELTPETEGYFPNATIKTILVNIPMDKINNVNDTFGNEWDVGPAAGNPFGTFITKTTTDDADLKDTDPITIYLTDDWNGTLPVNDDGNFISVHIIRIGDNDEGSAWVTGHCEGGGGGTQEIPEFPTIALPIAAIVGLAFLFQRGKE